MITYQELYDAFQECYKKKKKSPGAREFIIHLHKNLQQLLYEINNRSYKVSPSSVFIIKDPKLREIFAADFRDRIIHHLLFRELFPYLQEYFIEDCYSGIPGKGTLYGVMKIYEYLNSIKDPSWYVLKMDVRNFFMNIRKDLLASRMDKFILEKYQDKRKIEDIRYLTSITILSDPTKDCIIYPSEYQVPPEKSLFYLPQEKGLPIGNLSSQLFANFYMTLLDYFIKYTLGIDLYGRYVDDFIMFGPKNILIDAIPKIKEFSLNNLDLEISPNKIYIQPYHRGVKFLGSTIKPGRCYCGERVRGEMEKKLYQTPACQENVLSFISSVNSYLGLMNHYSSYNIRKNLLSNLPHGWDKYVIASNDYSKITPR